MFKLFKRKDEILWQTEMLKNVFSALPPQFSIYLEQINHGIIRKFLPGLSDIPGYRTGSYNSDVFDKYEKRNQETSVIKGVKVYDLKSSSFINLDIYILSGTVSGYVLHTNNKKIEIDCNNINVSNFKSVKITNKYIKALKNILGDIPKNIASLIDIQDTFEIETLKGNLHTIKDLENGNYIAIDKNGIVYGLIHSPYEIEILFDNKEDFFNALKSGEFNFTNYINKKTS